MGVKRGVKLERLERGRSCPGHVGQVHVALGGLVGDLPVDDVLQRGQGHAAGGHGGSWWWVVAGTEERRRAVVVSVIKLLSELPIRNGKFSKKKEPRVCEAHLMICLNLLVA